MGERKVLNKYIPADFDPRLVPRMKKSKDELIPVRMMLPFSIQCTTCSTFMYRGKKFNSKKEPVRGENGTYLGIQRYRFYIKCSVCSRPVTFLTDPKNADYEMETGATRNYEVWNDRDKTNEAIASEKETEEKADPMKALENRVLDSQREMADLDNLDEIKAMNSRHLKMLSKIGGADGKGQDQGAGGFHAAEAVLRAREVQQAQKKVEELNENGLTASEEALVQSIKFGNNNDNNSVFMDDRQNSEGISSTKSTGGMMIRRLDENDEYELEKRRQTEKAELEKQQRQMIESESSNKKGSKSSSTGLSLIPVIKRKRKRVPKSNLSVAEKKNTQEKNENDIKQQSTLKPTELDSEGGGLGGLLGAYGSDSD